MRFAGIDVASEKHVVAVVDERSEVLVRATPFTEDATGYKELLEYLGAPGEVLVAMEATGVYGRNLFAVLVTSGYSVAVVNPLLTHRFVGVDLQRTKTDAIDALGIARFAAQKRPVVTRLPDSATDELRELVRLRDRIVQDFGDRLRQIHRLVALGFPEFNRYVHSLDSTLATAILKSYPTAQAFVGVRPRTLAKLKYDGVHFVGLELATQLVEAAKISVGRHHGHAYRIQMQFYCEDMDVLRRRIKELDRNIETKLGEHEVGKLLTTIDGIGPNTAARLISVLGDPAHFRNDRALASYMGLVPALRQSGKSTSNRAHLSRVGNATLRSALYMPTLAAVKHSPWLRAFYLRLVSAGKPPKVALLASMRKLVTAVYSVAKNRRPSPTSRTLHHEETACWASRNPTSAAKEGGLPARKPRPAHCEGSPAAGQGTLPASGSRLVRRASRGSASEGPSPRPDPRPAREESPPAIRSAYNPRPPSSRSGADPSGAEVRGSR